MAVSAGIQHPNLTRIFLLANASGTQRNRPYYFQDIRCFKLLQSIIPARTKTPDSERSPKPKHNIGKIFYEKHKHRKDGNSENQRRHPIGHADFCLASFLFSFENNHSGTPFKSKFARVQNPHVSSSLDFKRGSLYRLFDLQSPRQRKNSALDKKVLAT